MSSITIQVPDFLRRQIERLAKEDGCSLDQFFTMAASEKIAVREAVDYIKERADRGSDANFLEAIGHIPAAPVTEEWDRKP